MHQVLAWLARPGAPAMPLIMHRSIRVLVLGVDLHQPKCVIVNGIFKMYYELIFKGIYTYALGCAWLPSGIAGVA